MDLDGQLLLGVYVMLVSLFVMGLFISKYYPVFQLRDKIIIEFLKIISTICVVLFCYFSVNYFNSIIMAYVPFGIAVSIFKLVKLSNSTENTEQFSPRDKLIHKAIQVCGIISMVVILAFVCSKNVSDLILPFVIIAGGYIFNLWKSYKQYLADKTLKQ